MGGMSDDIAIPDDVREIIEEVLKTNPSKEACRIRLVQEGHDEATIDPILDVYFTRRREAAKARRQGAENREKILTQAILGKAVDFGDDPGEFRQVAVARYRQLSGGGGLKALAVVLLLAAAGAGYGAFHFHQLADQVKWIASASGGGVLLLLALLLFRRGVKASDAKGLAALRRLAAEHGWWEGKKP